MPAPKKQTAFLIRGSLWSLPQKNGVTESPCPQASGSMSRPGFIIIMFLSLTQVVKTFLEMSSACVDSLPHFC